MDYRQIEISGHKYLEVVTPITALGKVAYLLQIEISLKSIEKEAASRIQEVLGISAMMIVVATILSGFLAGLLTEPLDNLVQATNEIARRNFLHRIVVKSDDEIGKVSKSFNLMANNLEQELSARKQIERDLQDHKAHLEKSRFGAYNGAKRDEYQTVRGN